MRYSVLLSGIYARQLTEQMLVEYLKNGIKVILFFDGESPDYVKIIQNQCEYLYVFISINTSSIPDLYIEDGKINKNDKSKVDSLYGIFNDFNFKQYEIEHFSNNKNLIVKASAGTGKTTVMIDRILFLLSTIDDIKPEDICMITFTNKAANSMRSKLQKKIMDRYKFSRQFKYLELMEMLSGMHISTIDAFFNKIIKSEGSVLGYGREVSVRSFTYEKKQIIESVVNDLFKEIDGDYQDKFVLKVYEYVDLALKCWEKLNSRGYYLDDIRKMNFGTAYGEKNNIINHYLQQILINAELRYRELKMRSNSMTINDLKADIDQLADVKKNVNIKKYKYIFIDEFQDTDNSQIKSVVWLQNLIDCKIFVVGDVKQSIYRFRGAEETAFERLKEKASVEFYEIDLIKNYRTAGNILEKLNCIFREWSNKSLLELPSGTDAEATMQASLEPENVTYRNEDELNSKLIVKIREVLNWQRERKQRNSSQDTSICLLVRANWEARKAARWLRAEGIPVVTTTEGGFFQTDAVLDVMHLLGAILYPTSAVMLFNYMHTSFCRKKPEYNIISNFEGNEEKLVEYFRKLLTEEGFQKILDDSRRKPFFQLMRELIDWKKPAAVYGAYLKQKMSKQQGETKQYEQQIKYDISTYQLNLNKLMELFSITFSSDFATVLSVYSYLNLMVATNKQEDALVPEVDKSDDNDVVQIMTVHKAKGLEFSTVIMPFTDVSFIKNIENIKGRYFELVTDTNVSNNLVEAGWTYKSRNFIYKNFLYDFGKSKEEDAIEREELRILYVALTRTMHQLICFCNNKRKPKSWGYYIKGIDSNY